MSRSSDIRKDLTKLARIVGKRKLLITAVRDVLREMYPEKYGKLNIGAIVSATGPYDYLKVKMEDGRRWVIVEPNEITIKSKRFPTKSILCKRCKNFCRGNNRIFICEKCGLKHIWNVVE